MRNSYIPVRLTPKRDIKPEVSFVILTLRVRFEALLMFDSLVVHLI